MMRKQSYRGFVWFTVDYFEPGPDVAKLELKDGSVVTIEAEPGEDLHRLIEAYWERETEEAFAKLDAALDAVRAPLTPELRERLMEPLPAETSPDSRRHSTGAMETTTNDHQERSTDRAGSAYERGAA